MYPMEPIRRSERYTSEAGADLSDALMAQAGEAWTANPSVAAYRWAELLLAGGSKISHDEARSMVADAGLEGRLEISSVTTPTKEFTQILIDRKRDELKRLETLERAPEGALSSVSQFGTSFLVSMADPVNIAASFIPVAREVRWAQRLSRSSSALSRAGGRATIGAIEGGAGAAMLEPLIFASKSYEQAEYGMMDSFLNIAFGGAFGGGLHTGFGGIGDAYRGFKKLEQPWDRAESVSISKAQERGLSPDEVAAIADDAAKMARDTPELRVNSEAQRTADALSTEEVEQVYRTSVAQLMEGRDVNVEPLLAHMDQTMRDGTKVRDLSVKDFAAKQEEIPALIKQEIDRLSNKIGLPPSSKLERMTQSRVKTLLDAQDAIAKGENLTPEHIEAIRQSKVAQAIEEGLPVPDRFTRGNEPLAAIAAKNRGRFAQSQIESQRATPQPVSVEKTEVIDVVEPSTELQKLDAEVADLERIVAEAEDVLGFKVGDDIDAKELMAKADRWATMAETAQLCVMRGG